MSTIDIKSGATILATGLLKLSGGVAMSATLVAVTDQGNTPSQLKLSTILTQVAGTLQIALDGGSYIDAQDTSGVDRFNVNRASASQQVNVDFASNPTSATTAVGAIRTYADGVSLSEAVTVLRNGDLGIGVTPTLKFQVKTTTGGTNSSIAFMNATGGATIIGVNDAGSALTYLQFRASSFNFADANVSIGNTVGSIPTARLQIKGSGSTSATTSLLVQNSAGVSSLQVTDDGSVFNYGKGSVTSNTAFGVLALSSNTSGVNNSAYGIFSLFSNTIGNNNSAFGRSTLYYNINGGNNVAVGQSALQENISGSDNSVVGLNGLLTNTSGSDNSALGRQTNSGNFSGSTILGKGATATANNQCVFGSVGTNAGAVTAAVTVQANVWNVVINGVARQILLA